ncbi:uncharacterized protein PAC_12524 [Phialocephala subalpina]|uniref:Zn(2)-C6 fungal-type domain-containing protein n=1 Tax=Phialocephala subalpina TaxID=576137 RepID=A0A1L7XCD1_9HELO|nr:uncharacterized protein PAC_12524 [Phialocephala subalpina]
MPIADHKAGAISGRIRRHRVTTACIECRNRRVKCDRLKPACLQCSRTLRPCNYARTRVKKIEFEHVTGVQPNVQSEDSWTSVLNLQRDAPRVAGSTDVSKPSWIVAEEEELCLPRPRRCIPGPHGTPINSLGFSYFTLLANELPSAELCGTFFENFLRTVHPVVPVCHVPTLEREYANFWKNLSSNTSAELWLLVSAILYTGSHNLPYPDQTSSKLLHLLGDVASHMELASYYICDQDSALQLLQAHLIMNTYRTNQLSPFAAFGFLPQAIRFGQQLRLHVEHHTKRNEKISSNTSCNFESAEAQRRIWYHLVFLDVESVIANGLPPIIRSDGYVTKLPSMAYDTSLSLHSDEQQAGNVGSMMIAMQGQYQWARHMQKWFESLPTPTEVTSFKTLIEHLLLLIPKDGSIENEWVRTYLRMQIDRAYCMLGLRFWQLDRFTGTGCQSEIVRTARSFLTNYLKLSILSPNLSWFLPGLIQPLHALIILLMHLSTCTDICSEESLSRSLLDDVFELRVSRILAGTIISEKARINSEKIPQRANSRYSMLVELRARIWKRCGWDRDGKGKDPWGGRLDDFDEDEDATKEAAEGVTDVELKDGLQSSLLSESFQPQSIGDLMDEDPLNMFQWDKWEGLTEGLFVP